MSLLLGAWLAVAAAEEPVVLWHAYRGAEEAALEQAALREMENELRATREDLQTTIEELESSNEELKSANEELLSMNE